MEIYSLDYKNIYKEESFLFLARYNLLWFEKEDIQDTVCSLKEIDYYKQT